MRPAASGLEIAADPEQVAGDIGTAFELEPDVLEDAVAVFPEGALPTRTLLPLTEGEIEIALGASVHAPIVHLRTPRAIREDPDLDAAKPP